MDRVRQRWLHAPARWAHFLEPISYRLLRIHWLAERTSVLLQPLLLLLLLLQPLLLLLLLLQ